VWTIWEYQINHQARKEEERVPTEMEHGDESRADHIRRHVRPDKRVVPHHRGAGNNPIESQHLEVVGAARATVGTSGKRSETSATAPLAFVLRM
jgi:hypothetical protein